MRLLAVFFAFALTLCAQTNNELAPQVLLLAKIRSRMVFNLDRQPNYTCVETVTRSHRASPSRKFRLIDTLRLEVALLNGQETFGWPGAKSFEYTDLRDLVSEGAFGNGDFASHARAIFEGPFTHFDYRGAATIDGRDSVRFDYQVPLLGSRYTLRVDPRQATVAYHGSIYADPNSLDVERIEVVADDIPAALELDAATDRLDYGRVAIGEGDFLLPRESELVMRDAAGGENRNLVHFASCREFSGQSHIDFTDVSTLTQPAAAVRQVEVPSGLELALKLASDLDTRSAAVGDAVDAILETEIKQNGQIVFPRGSLVHGRILRLEHRDDQILVGLAFFEIESVAARASLHLKFESAATREFVDAAPRSLPATHHGEGILPLAAGHVQLNRGTLMYWRT